MRKMLLVIAAVCFFFTGYASAQETVTVDENVTVVEKKFSGITDKIVWKQGYAYSVQEGSSNFMSTVELFKLEKWIKGLTLEAGYMGDGNDSDHKIVGVMSYPLLNLKEKGVTIPILDLVDANLGVWYGAGNLQWDIMDTRADYGLSLSLLSFKW